jgi:hypothetical protein
MSTGRVVTPFKRNKKVRDLRSHLDGPSILGKIDQHLRALDKLESELEDSVKDFERNVHDENGEVIRVETYRSTVLDKETLGVYHIRMNARKLQIDTALKLLNKVMPDLKAIETTDDIVNAGQRALKAFAAAAAITDQTKNV